MTCEHLLNKESWRLLRWQAVSTLSLFGLLSSALARDDVIRVEANRVAEVSLVSAKAYQNPFVDLELVAIVTAPDGTQVRMPAFWAGGDRWRFRYASGSLGGHRWKLECSDSSNAALHGAAGRIEVTDYRGENPLFKHGPIRVADDGRRFAHADGTPFFWLADTWWKNLCQRMTWEGFQELTADRRAKGFTAVQIVCGPYPDEEMMQPQWENEGGRPYEDRRFSVVNPDYFEYADRRIAHLVNEGIVPVIVGGWGRPQQGGRSTLQQVGLEGFQRHWRQLIARYAAYPVVWIVGGEAKDAYGPWDELAKAVNATDPFQRPLTYHAPGDPRRAIEDNAVFDFDMVAIGHDGLNTARKTLTLMKSCLAREPLRPVLCGEACYEGHMQTNFQNVQRRLFWSFMLSGAAGHTYGAAGVWHASVENDPGIDPVYDFTTWNEGRQYPGSTQLGLGKKLLQEYPWSRFEPHPEWVEPGCFAAGIAGEVRFIYAPQRKIYDWRGPLVKDLESHISWRVYYFDPVTGSIFKQETIAASSGEDEAAERIEFQTRSPSPQDWVLVLERLD